MKQKKYSIRFTILAALFFASTLGSQADIISEHYSIIKKKRYKKRYYRKSRATVLSEPKKWQTALAYLGYYHGDINGDIYSFDTHNAIKQFQKTHQIPDTGFPNQELKDYLSYVYNVSSIAKYLNYEGKDKRSNGKKYQAALKVHGVYHDKIDGTIGSGTKKSILDYKQKMGLDTQDSVLSSEEKSELVNSAKKLLKEQYSTFQLKEDQNIIQAINNKTETISQGDTIKENTEDLSKKTNLESTTLDSNGSKEDDKITLPEKTIEENTEDTLKADQETAEPVSQVSNDEADKISDYNSSISDDIANIAQEIVQSTKEVTAK